MQQLQSIITRGIKFVQKNPQIIYTLFLVVVIPIGFLYTSDRFLRVAKENQDGLERSRIGLLQDVFVLFAAEKFDQPEAILGNMKQIASQNQTMKTFDIIQRNGQGGYVVISSIDMQKIGQTIELDPLSTVLVNSSAGDVEESHAAEYYRDDIRYWRAVRAIQDPNSTNILGFVLVDMSMEIVDEVQKDNVLSAYLTLALIIILIILLLARQARIIDYATLYQKLKEIDKLKDDFVSMAAHELRSPLMIIRGYADELKSIQNIDEKGMRYIGNIELAANQLNTLVADILDVAKLQDGCLSFNYDEVDVSNQITSIVESFARPAEDKNLALWCEVSELPPIRVDVDRFRQVMVNFIGNAIKYTPRGSVRVSADVVRDEVAIRVADTGMGISAEDQKKLFQKFFRIKNEETSGITGTGLGLWITNEIVRSMGGKISVESIKGTGTTFIVSFPVVKK